MQSYTAATGKGDIKQWIVGKGMIKKIFEDPSSYKYIDKRGGPSAVA